MGAGKDSGGGDVSPVEYMITAIADMLDGLGHVAVGARSPIPGSAAHLAAARSGGRLRVSILGSRKHSSFTDGARELFDCAGQGRIDAFFLSGGQIDGGANINLVGVGDIAAYPRAEARFPGSFGSAYLYYVVPRVILFTQEHSRRVLVDKVDFVSAPGTSAPGVHRPGGPYALVTPRCVFRFDRDARAVRAGERASRRDRGPGARGDRVCLRRTRQRARHADARRRHAAHLAHGRGAHHRRHLSGLCRQGVGDRPLSAWDCSAGLFHVRQLPL